MFRVACFVALVLSSIPGLATAHLREFEITPISAGGPIFVFRDRPNNEATIIHTSLTVNATVYQQGRVTISPKEARQVICYRVDPKPEVATSIAPINFKITPTDDTSTL